MRSNEAVRERILELCRENNYSINKLANICGIPQSTISGVLNESKRSTTLATVKKLCDGLNITIIDFFDSDLFRGLEQEIY